MRVAFLGTPAFAVPTLQKLLDCSYEIGCVFTQPDRPSGRGLKLQPSPIKVLAQAHGIPVYQPNRIREEENREAVEKLQPDFIVVIAYGQILPGWLLQLARIAPINVHASLLPRYRGAAPIPWAILNGESVTGITTIIVQERLDAGPMLLQQSIPIPLDRTAGDLTIDLAAVGADLLIRTLTGLQENTLKPILQDESQVSWAPRITKEMAQISWERSSIGIHNQIRAMNPWPVASTVFRDERLQVWRSLPADPSLNSRNTPGAFLGLSQTGMHVQCGEGTVLELLEVQMPARSRVSGREFASGVRLQTGELIFH